MPRSATPSSQAPDTEAIEPVDDGQRRRRSGPALNRVELIGRLAADPDLRYTSAGIPVTRVRVATNDGEAVEYHDVVVWRQVAEFAAQYLTKGRLVFVEGRLHSRSWDGQDGVRRRTTEVIGATLQVLSPRPTEGEPADG